MLCALCRCQLIYPLWTSMCSKGLKQRLCTVPFFFPPTLPSWVILCDVVGWQKGLLGISLAFVYCWFIFLINFSLCQKANYVLFVSEGLVGEFNFHAGFPSSKTHISCDQFLISMFSLGMSIGKKHHALMNEQECLMHSKII